MKYIQRIKGKDSKFIESSFTFENKNNEQIYIQICSKIWGCVPVDVNWAISTKPYKEQLLKI